MHYLSINGPIENSIQVLSAIMFTDIAGYTKQMAADESKAMEMVRANRELQKESIGKYDGKFLKEIGDGVMASFPTASTAVFCAKEIQKKVSEN